MSFDRDKIATLELIKVVGNCNPTITNVPALDGPTRISLGLDGLFHNKRTIILFHNFSQPPPPQNKEG